MTVRLIHGDCLEALATLEPDSVHAIVTDPPYGLSFMGQHWDHAVPGVEYWRACYRVLKPGGHCLAFAGTRTYHRMACAIEDAGFDIRDMVTWHYGSGFPKSHDVSKAIDRAAGTTGSYGAPKSAAHAGWIDRGAMRGGEGHEGYQRPWMKDEAAVDRNARRYEPATDAAKQWNGWGTALKPASEPIVFARKPLCGTVAENVLAHGTGALNIDGCRIEFEETPDAATNPLYRASNGYKHAGNDDSGSNSYSVKGRGEPSIAHQNGRWPANVCHDGSEEVLAGFPQSEGQQGDVRGTEPSECHNGVYSGPRKREGIEYVSRNDSGSAARFFYCAKATTADRDDGLIDLALRNQITWQTGNSASGEASNWSKDRNTGRRNTHPTVKPTALMQWLVRLVTPPGGIVLDPFMGTGSTGRGCVMEGFDFIGIEREAPYVELARLRIAAAAKKAPPPTLADLFAEAGEAA